MQAEYDPSELGKYSFKFNAEDSIKIYLVKMLKDLKKYQQDFCKKHKITFDDAKIKIISICNSNLELNKYEIKAVNELDNGFRRLLDRCKIPHTNLKVLYSYRHSYITELIKKNISVITIAKQ